jgi:hypothetical protein
MNLDWSRAVPHDSHLVAAGLPTVTQKERSAAALSVADHLIAKHGWSGKARGFTRLQAVHVNLHEQMDRRRKARPQSQGLSPSQPPTLNEASEIRARQEALAAYLLKRAKRMGTKIEGRRDRRYIGGQRVPGGAMESSRRRH